MNPHPLTLLIGSLALSASLAAAQPTPLVSTPVAEPTISINSYVLDGPLPLDEAEVARVLAPFVGSAKTIRDIEAASKALEAAVGKAGYTFYRVFVPAQKPANGLVTLKVIEYRVHQVEVTGNEHFGTDNIRRGLPELVEGKSPNIHAIAEQLATVNNNPSKQVNINFRESTQNNALDAAVRVRDSDPVTYALTFSSNTSLSGQGANGRDNIHRVSGVYQHSNLFDRDHVLTLSYTTDPENISGVSLLGAYYQAPIYSQSLTVSGFLAMSDIDSGTVQQGSGTFDVNGGGRFAGLRVTQSLRKINTWQHSISLGLEERYFKNSTTFNTAQVFPDVSSRMLNPAYNFRMDEEWGIVAGNIGLAANVGGGGQSNSVLAHALNGGKKDWLAWRYSAEVFKRQAKWQFAARLKGQYASHPLVSGEQFGLGGVNSVRGFSDRVIAGDTGYQWGIEAIGPLWVDVPIRTVVFAEGGWAKSNLTLASDHLIGAGVGLRFGTGSLQLSADLATALEKPAAETRSDPWRLSFAATYRF